MTLQNFSFDGDESRLPSGDELKAEGMQRSYEATTQEWRGLARDMVRNLARTLPELSTDDLWAAGLPKPENADPRAVGKVMLDAATEGILEKGGYTNTGRAEAHSRPVRVWRSRIYRDPSL